MVLKTCWNLIVVRNVGWVLVQPAQLLLLLSKAAVRNVRVKHKPATAVGIIPEIPMAIVISTKVRQAWFYPRLFRNRKSK
jgi:hypothetical protein